MKKKKINKKNINVTIANDVYMWLRALAVRHGLSAPGLATVILTQLKHNDVKLIKQEIEEIEE